MDFAAASGREPDLETVWADEQSQLAANTDRNIARFNDITRADHLMIEQARKSTFLFCSACTGKLIDLSCECIFKRIPITTLRKCSSPRVHLCSPTKSTPLDQFTRFFIVHSVCCTALWWSRLRLRRKKWLRRPRLLSKRCEPSLRQGHCARRGWTAHCGRTSTSSSNRR